jgi:hypothetical protein
LDTPKIYQIGELKQRVIDILKLNLSVCTIYIGDDNIEHIKSEHPNDYSLYGADIKNILENPTYVSKHPIDDDDSIHYIKTYSPSNDYVKVVVRPTKRRKLFVRSLFVLSKQNIYQYWTSHSLKSY